ncbi:tetratricopeptide repeat protein [Micromonospora sp. CMU55-4]|uniref:tetratricopeptide repeat protein n=1 Tax=Micromonospora sp. CMU55-4 TaxID=2717028 RepID=UPI00140797FB|nr:tetratricopeptide repeat protein [Micromonospora sp. CMU55-4]NHO85126.1 tetratricopeptide repeat protein [Micromonospora sp. CMU55-4]
MTPVDDVRRRLADYFAAKDPELVSDDGARVDARRLLIDAIGIHGDGEVAIDAKLLGLAALLFWCRWLEAPTDHHDPDCQSAYRLYRVLLTVDREAQVPPQLVGPLADPANDEPVSALLHHEARDLIDGCLRQFDDIAVDLGILLARCAVALAEPGTAEQAEYSCNLGAGLFARYRHHNAEADLNEAVEMFRTAVEFGSGDAREQARYLANLGAALHTRYVRWFREDDLTLAVRLHRAALRHLPQKTRYRSQYASVLHTRYEVSGRSRDLERAIRHSQDTDPMGLANLALMLRDRFERLGEIADLQRSIALLRDVLNGTDAEDPDQARRLSALGAVLNLRFTAIDDPADLDTAISLHREAVRRARNSDPHRLDYLSNLGHALHDRYEDRGSLTDLHDAVTAHTAAGHNDPLQAGNRANVLAARFKHLDDIADLDAALRAYIAVLADLPYTHIQRGSQLTNLGSIWFERFQRTQEVADLVEAIKADRAAVRCTPPRHLDRSRRLANLAMALDSWYERSGEPADLDEAIRLHRRAYEIAPLSRRRHHGAGLAIALHLRYHLHGGAGDLAECIGLLLEAVDCRPDHPDQPRRKTLLASALLTRHDETADPADLAEAVTLIRAAVAATPPRHVQRVGRQSMLGSTLSKTGDPALVDEAITVLQTVAGLTDASSPLGYRLRTLGDALEARWELTRATVDLAAAIDAYRRAIVATGTDEPDQALNRYDLAGALAALADATGRADLRRDAVTEYQAATRQRTAPALIRIHAAGEWAAHALTLRQPQSATEAFAAAVDLLPRLAWTGLERRDQERALRGWNTLASDAAAAALAAGHPEWAIELGDQGRSLLWEQHLRLRREAHELAERHPRLAARFRRVRLKLLSTIR